MAELVVGKEVAARVEMRVEMASTYPPAGSGTITSVAIGGQQCTVMWDSGQERKHNIGDQNKFELMSSRHQYSHPTDQDQFRNTTKNKPDSSLFNRSDLQKRKAKSLVEDAIVELSTLETSFNQPQIHRHQYTADGENRPKTTLGVGLKGVSIDYIIPGGPAHLSEQLEKGDQILTIDRLPVGPDSITRQIVGSDMPGTPVRLEVMKQSSRQTVEVNLIRASIPNMQSAIKVFERILELRLNAESIKGQEEALFPKRRTTAKILEQLEEAINTDMLDKSRHLKYQNDSLRESSRKIRQNLESSLDEFETFATEQQGLLHTIDDAMRDHDKEEKQLHSRMQELVARAEKSAEEASHYKLQLSKLEGGTPEAQALRSVVQSQDKELTALKSIVASREKELVGLRAQMTGSSELEEALRTSSRQIEIARTGLAKADEHIKEQGRRLKEQERLKSEALGSCAEMVRELKDVRRAQVLELEELVRQSRVERAQKEEAQREAVSAARTLQSLVPQLQALRQEAHNAQYESGQLETARMAQQLENVSGAYKRAMRDAQSYRQNSEHLQAKVGELENALGELTRQLSVLEAEALAREKLLAEAEREESLLQEQLAEVTRTSDLHRDRDQRSLREQLARSKQRCAALERAMVRVKGMAAQIHADAGALAVGEGSISRALPAVGEKLEEQSALIRRQHEELRQGRMELARLRERVVKAEQAGGAGDKERDEIERQLYDARAQLSRMRGECRRLQDVEKDNQELRAMNASLREVIATMEHSVEREKRLRRDVEDALRDAKLSVFEQGRELGVVATQLENEREEVSRLGAKTTVQDKRNKELRNNFDELQRAFEDTKAEESRLRALTEDQAAQLAHKEEALQTYRAQAVGADAAFAESQVTAARADHLQGEVTAAQEAIAALRQSIADKNKDKESMRLQLLAGQSLQEENRKLAERADTLQKELVAAGNRHQELRKTIDDLRLASQELKQKLDAEHIAREGQDEERARLRRELDIAKESLHAQLRLAQDKITTLQKELAYCDAALGHCRCKQTLDATVVSARNLPVDLQRVTVALSVDGSEQVVTTKDASGEHPQIGEALTRPVRPSSRELVVSLYSSPKDSGVGSLVGFAVVPLAQLGVGQRREEWLTLQTRPDADTIGDIVRGAAGQESQVSLVIGRSALGEEEAGLRARVQELLAAVDVLQSTACPRPTDHTDMSRAMADKCPRREDHLELQVLKGERERVMRDGEAVKRELDAVKRERDNLARPRSPPPAPAATRLHFSPLRCQLKHSVLNQSFLQMLPGL